MKLCRFTDNRGDLFLNPEYVIRVRPCPYRAGTLITITHDTEEIFVTERIERVVKSLRSERDA